MKTQIPHEKTTESTYALLVHSEESERNFSETVIYAFMLLSTVFSIWQFAHQPFNVPANGLRSAPIVQIAAAKPLNV